MAKPSEVEVKFLIADIAELENKLKQVGFTLVTPATHELNTLYDLPGNKLRSRGEILRLRKYGERWVLTHKSKGTAGIHKVRIEQETTVADGEQTDAILRALGYEPTFIYEKFRAEWTDNLGEVVIDRTPIGDFGEIEGSPEWIDATAARLGISHGDYITASYGALFEDWRKRHRSKATHMTFWELGTPEPTY